LKNGIRKLMACAAVAAVSMFALAQQAKAALMDSNLTGGITELSTTLTTGDGSTVIYWVVGIGLGMVALGVVVSFVRKGKSGGR